MTHCASGDGSTQNRERVVILLDAPEEGLTLSFSSDAREAQRLAREMGHGRYRGNPVHDFIESILDTFLATVSRVVLEDAGNQGLTAQVEVSVPGRGINVLLPCYPPDALALALRRGAPSMRRQVLWHMPRQSLGVPVIRTQT